MQLFHIKRDPPVMYVDRIKFFSFILCICIMGSGCVRSPRSEPTSHEQSLKLSAEGPTSTTAIGFSPSSLEVQPEIPWGTLSSTSTWETFSDAKLGIRFLHPPKMDVIFPTKFPSPNFKYVVKLIDHVQSECMRDYSLGLVAEHLPMAKAGTHRYNESLDDPMVPSEQDGIEFVSWAYTGPQQVAFASGSISSKCLSDGTFSSLAAQEFRTFLQGLTLTVENKP